MLSFYAAGLSRDNWLYIAYAMTAVTVVVFLLTMVMLRRIQVAVACFKVRKEAVWAGLPMARPLAMAGGSTKRKLCMHNRGQSVLGWLKCV